MSQIADVVNNVVQLHNEAIAEGVALDASRVRLSPWGGDSA